MNKKFLTRREIAEAVGLSSVTLWRLERDGKFPHRHQLSPGRVAWRAEEVEAWIAGRQVKG